MYAFKFIHADDNVENVQCIIQEPRTHDINIHTYIHTPHNAIRQATVVTYCDKYNDLDGVKLMSACESD